MSDRDGGLTIDAVPLRPGETCRDPRLQRMQLSGLRSVAFAVVDSAGAPIARASAVAFQNVEQHRFEGYQLANGAGSFVTTADHLDLLVRAEGYCAMIVRDVRDGQQIALPPAPVVRVSLPAGLAPVAPPFALVVTLRPEQTAWEQESYRLSVGAHGTRSGSDSLPWREGRQAECTAGTAELRPSSTGTYLVEWAVTKAGTTKHTAVGAPQRIVVGEGENAVVAEFSAADLAAARER